MIRPAVLALLLTAPATLQAQEAIPPVLALEWTLAEVDGQPVAYSATLSVDARGRLTGNAPCNSYFAEVSGPLPEFRPEAMGSTRMACAELAEEAAYFALLRGVDRLTHSDRELHLSGAGHSLIFRRPLD